MKNTNNKAFRQQVFNYLCGALYDFDGDEAACARHMRERFESEYNHPANQRRIPNLQERVAEWHSGLALNVACYYSDIIELAERWHECTLTEKQRETVCENWFRFLAFNTIKLWERHDV